jgi:hypothetical protein
VCLRMELRTGSHVIMLSELSWLHVRVQS